MIVSINESALKSIIKDAILEYTSSRKGLDDIVESAISAHRSVLYEMAFKRKDYKDKGDNLSQQIIENWCLVRHCTIWVEKPLAG